jgi:hypothetical protein
VIVWNVGASGRLHRVLAWVTSDIWSGLPRRSVPRHRLPLHLTVHEAPGEPETSRGEWSGTFTPAGVGDEEAVALFHGIDAEGLDGRCHVG